MSGRIVIVGGGEAGVNIAVTLRELGYDGAIELIGDEPVAPYQRPPLSKEYLAPGTPTPDLSLRAPEFFAEHRIALRTGRRVTDATLHAEGGQVTLDDGRVLAFDGLALATGCAPRSLPVPGAELDGVVSLRTADDAAALGAALDRARTVAIVGGGFIGLEVAAAARRRGAAVVVVEAADRLLARVAAAPVSDFVRTHHETEGIEFVLGAAVSAIAGREGRVAAVDLADGTRLPADLVVVGVGAMPNIALAQRIGLVCDRGVVVDAHARTSHPRVVSAGDCTVTEHPHLTGRLFGMESVHNAAEQGRAAAYSLLGRAAPERGAPWFWSNQGTLKLQIAGVSDGHDRTVVRRGGDRLTVLYYREHRLIAADSINHPRDHMAAKRALSEGRTIDPERAGDPDVPLKTLVLEGSGS